MKNRFIIFMSFLVLALWAFPQNGEKHRIIVLTDIENEPDDAQSLIRYLLYSNQWDNEGLIATTSCWQRDQIADWRIYEILDAYENYKQANHPPVVKLNHPNEITVRSNQTVTLDASPTTDPDGDKLTYKWYLYFEPGSYLLYRDYANNANLNYQLDINNNDMPVATFTVPRVEIPQDLHIILEVTDNGNPSLTRYQRVIVNIIPSETN